VLVETANGNARLRQGAPNACFCQDHLSERHFGQRPLSAALPSRKTENYDGGWNVRFGSGAVIPPRSTQRPLCANSGHSDVSGRLQRSSRAGPVLPEVCPGYEGNAMSAVEERIGPFHTGLRFR
jgi:hypothetical protein